MRKVIRSAERPPEEIVAGFRELMEIYSPSCVVSDAQERYGVMHSSMKPAVSGRFAGPAVTVRLYPGDLVDPLDALENAQPGDVVVIDAAGETETSIWGGLMSGLSKQKGIVGAVIDGSCRDTDEARDIGFSVYSRGVVPRASHTAYSKRREPIEINVTIKCAGQVVNPGDIIIADEIGVVVVPKDWAAEVLEGARALAEQEEKVRQRIQAGKTLNEILDEFGRL